jgi:type II secretory pathway component GspD/PulD (secretin)
MMAAAWVHAQDAQPVAAPAQAAPAATAPATNTPEKSKAVPDVAKSGIAKPDTAKKDGADSVTTGGPVKAGSLRAQRKAAKLYLQGVKLLKKEQPEAAWKLLKQAADLEPDNATYLRAAELARQSAVTQLVQQASRERSRAANADSAKLLRHAMEIDPKNPLVLQHLSELEDETTKLPVGNSAIALQDPETPLADGAISLEPSADKHSFHLKTNARQVVQEVFRAYGIESSVHESVQARQVRLDLDDVSFADAARVVGLVTGTFWEPLDPHRVVVARDTRENRTQFQRQGMETIYLGGLDEKQLTDVNNLAKNVFEVQQASVQPTRGTMTIRAPTKTLAAFNRTVGGLEKGQSQLELDIKVIQLAHVSARETGTTFFQQTGVYNAFAEINSVIQQNQSAVQQIISQGLVANASTLQNQIEIIAILLSSGQLTGTPFNQGFALFGGGLTESLLAPGPATLNFSLTSSDTRTLDDIHLRLGDNEAGTFKIGQRYPIETSSYSSAALPNIPGLSAVATAAQSQTVPQIQYQDLGLTVKATPKAMRSNDVALTLELKIESLGGTSLNDIPILNSQQFSGVLTLKEGETAVLLSDLSRQESRALSGLPGVSDIPGFQDVSDIARNQNVARLLILVTPYVVRGTQKITHGPMLVVDKPANAH